MRINQCFVALLVVLGLQGCAVGNIQWPSRLYADSRVVVINNTDLPCSLEVNAQFEWRLEPGESRYVGKFIPFHDPNDQTGLVCKFYENGRYIGNAYWSVWVDQFLTHWQIDGISRVRKISGGGYD